jgi:membrane associated rhomboid family serine protease
MTRIKIGERTWVIHDHEWPQWVRMGWIPPSALVFSSRWTRGIWRRADSLEVYHLFRPSDVPVVPETVPTSRRRGPFGIFRAPGPSVTEMLILANVLVAGLLYLHWGDAYGTEQGIWALSKRLRELLAEGWFPVLFIPLFLHASLTHLTGNMLTFFAGGAVVEEYYGRRRMLLLYLTAGITGALLSLTRSGPFLSVGASGAIMGMFGVALVFLLRERKYFSERQKFKMRRIYLPFFALMVLPAILHADFYAHLGGFLGGALLALFVPPLPDRVPRPGHPRPGEVSRTALPRIEPTGPTSTPLPTFDSERPGEPTA